MSAIEYISQYIDNVMYGQESWISQFNVIVKKLMYILPDKQIMVSETLICLFVCLVSLLEKL